MRLYSEAEHCLLLLCAVPGTEPPIRERLYRKVFRAIQALRPDCPDATADLTQDTLMQLGCTAQEAGAILARLAQPEALKLYLHNLEAQSIQIVTRLSPDYPQRLRERMGDRAPLLLYCGGNTDLFAAPCISLVGSRQLEPNGKRFSALAGSMIAEQGYTYCSGGAAGADTVGYQAAMDAGGSAVVFLADSLLDQLHRKLYTGPLQEGRLLLVSEHGPEEPFSTPRALSRNHLIHALGQKVLVSQSSYGSGGTWHGTLDNLKAGWSPVFVNDTGDPGSQGLIERGAVPVTQEDLADLSALCQDQTSLFS
jgi:predicted Rossmann fold nucleotide-binding protein DprA/Smf involved in DNA uptake